MHPVKVIGFDFDQTLADSASGIENCLLHTGRIYGVSLEPDLLTTIARSGLKLEPMLQEFIPEEYLSQARHTFLEIYPQLGVAGTQPMAGATQLIQKLRDAKYRLVVISAKSQQNLELSLKHLQFEFHEVYGGASGQEKTDCIIRSNALIYIGDQESDVVAARNAGIRAILVNQFPPKFDQQEYPCEYFENLTDLFGSIDELIEP
jgi:phosphoglycolate phosphatase-like HAD superfamily hydrolase